MPRYIYFFVIYYISLNIFIPGSVAFSGQPKAKTIYSAISKGRFVNIKGTMATFNDGNNFYTIFGAVQDASSMHVRPSDWSVGKRPYQVLIVQEPISNELILPYSDPPANVKSGDTIQLRACRGEYEPASLVIRSGSYPLKNIRITIETLKKVNGHSEILPENIDIRVVKCWYQAGISVSRNQGDKKWLTPELLLHDSELVKVDMNNQVNLVRNIHKLYDAKRLVPFVIPERTNQQLWITLHVPEDAIDGEYHGNLTISFNIDDQIYQDKINLKVEVLPFDLMDSPIEYALFYLAWLKPSSWKGLDSRGKTPLQMLEEFSDMFAHGLTNVAIDHNYIINLSGEPDFSNFTQVISLFRKAGFKNSNFLYLDWKVRKKEDHEAYEKKIKSLRKLTLENGFKNLYVYNLDEQDIEILIANKHTFDIAHNFGARNFVTTRPEFAHKLKGLLDIGILHRNSSPTQLHLHGIIPWAYAAPQAGEERPYTYRETYGLKLWLDGYDGACNYAYQTAELPWNDWVSKRWRPHTMAYPTLDKPIPTLQWEGWREGIDDVRYAVTLISTITGHSIIDTGPERKKLLLETLGSPLPHKISQLRSKIIEKLLSIHYLRNSKDE